MRFPHGETFTIIDNVVSGEDAYGNDVYSPTETPIDGCAFAPAGSTESVQGQDLVISQDTLYLPEGVAAPSPTARIRRGDGTVYEVDGLPQVFVNPFTGSTPGPVVKLKVVTG